ncbi:MAG: acyl-CoA thioester hydrolase [Polaribacter sp.]|jgi:acyl-CoA thioester hydrolase
MNLLLIINFFFRRIKLTKKIHFLITQSTSFRVRYGETDQMGVVYHGNYAQFFEIGRIDWLRSFGISYKNMEENNVMLPVVTLQCNFKKSAEFDDEITVKTTLKKIPTVKIEFEYEIFNQKNELLTTGYTMLAFINMKTKKPMRCPDYILEKLL